MGYEVRAPTKSTPFTTEERNAGNYPAAQAAVKGTTAIFLPIHNNQKFLQPRHAAESEVYMEFFNSAIEVLQTLVIALGAGLGIWGVINLLEGYGNDNPGAKSQGMKQLMAGGGVALIGMVLVPLLSGLFG